MELEKNLKKLVSFKTVTADKGSNKKAMDWVRKELKGCGFYVRLHESEGYVSLVATTRKTKRPKLFLSAHIDVVPAPQKLFRPETKKGRLIARGVIDMKFAIASYLKLAREIGEDSKKYDLGIMITSDEEVGGFNGTKFLLDQGYSSKLAFLPDNGDTWKFEKEAKGIIHILAESKGKSAHASKNWEGRNAIEELMGFLTKLKEKFPKEPCKDKNHYHPTLNIGRIEGGEAANSVPASARAWLDIRFTAKQRKSGAMRMIENSKKKFPKIKTRELISAPAFVSDPEGKYTSLFSEILKEKYGISSDSVRSHGSTDGRFFAMKKIPTVTILPRGGGHHSDEEWIDLKSLNQFHGALREFVEKTVK